MLTIALEDRQAGDVKGDAALEAIGVSKTYRRLSRTYRRRPALADVSLRIPAGSVTALIGPNGAGKSTLLRAWVGFERPSAGRVLVCGLDPFRERVRALEAVAYVPQSPALYRALSIDDHLDLVARSREQFDRDRAEAHLDELGLELGSRSTELSGGERAQVTLAIALGCRPRVLVLDEPLASLDPQARSEFLTAVKRDVRERGTTVVLSSHVVSDVQSGCDRVVVLGRGRVLLDEAMDQVAATHVALPDDVPVPEGLQAIARVADDDAPRVTVARIIDPVDVDGVQPASLDRIFRAYLLQGRAERRDPGT